jgi:hypothetical protein
MTLRDGPKPPLPAGRGARGPPTALKCVLAALALAAVLSRAAEACSTGFYGTQRCGAGRGAGAAHGAGDGRRARWRGGTGGARRGVPAGPPPAARRGPLPTRGRRGERGARGARGARRGAPAPRRRAHPLQGLHLPSPRARPHPVFVPRYERAQVIAAILAWDKFAKATLTDMVRRGGGGQRGGRGRRRRSSALALCLCACVPVCPLVRAHLLATPPPPPGPQTPDPPSRNSRPRCAPAWRSWTCRARRAAAARRARARCRRCWSAWGRASGWTPRTLR